MTSGMLFINMLGRGRGVSRQCTRTHLALCGFALTLLVWAPQWSFGQCTNNPNTNPCYFINFNPQYLDLVLGSETPPGSTGILGSTGTLELIANYGANPILMAPGGGVVGIGTQAPCTSSPSTCLLSVAGGIYAEEVVVNSSGSDYVFDPNYKLQPLSEVAAYIEKNHHLPDIPAAEKMQKDGLSVGDVETKLLAKIEELTLHMIQQEKENQQLRERITRLEKNTAVPSGSSTTPTDAK